MKLELANAYIPYQENPTFYSIYEGFCTGTIFPELDKEYTPKSRGGSYGS